MYVSYVLMLIRRETVMMFFWRGDVPSFFSFLYFLKIKISKIYVRFEIFQKYPPVAPYRATGPKCNFFFFKFATRSLAKKKGPVAPHPNGPQGPVAHPRGDRVPPPYI